MGMRKRLIIREIQSVQKIVFCAFFMDALQVDGEKSADLLIVLGLLVFRIKQLLDQSEFFGKIWDQFVPAQPDDRLWVRVATAFSLPSNLKLLLSTHSFNGSITCLHGIRVLSMLWVSFANSVIFSALNFGESQTFIFPFS